MAVNDLLNTISFDSNVKTADYSQKYTSSDNNNAFSNVFDLANKSYNSSLDKTNQFSYNDLNKTAVKKDFKSEYESFNNKIDAEKNTDSSVKDFSAKKAEDSENSSVQNQISADAIKTEPKPVEEKKAGKDKPEELSDSQNNKAVSDEQKEIKADNKPVKEKEIVKDKPEALSDNQNNKAVSGEQKKINPDNKPVEEKEVVKDKSKENPEIINNTVLPEIINLNTLNVAVQSNIQNAATAKTTDDKETQPQSGLKNANQKIISLQTNNTAVELKDNPSTNKLAEELTPIQKQIANEKITNKQAENILQQQSLKEDSSAKQIQTTKINPEELNKSETTKTEPSETDKQAQSQKPGVLVTDNVLNTLNAVDKNQIKPAQSEKLSDIVKNEDAKPVITNIEVKNNSTKSDLEGQNQKQPQQDLKSGVNSLQSLTLTYEENSLQKLDSQKITQFDKILNSTQVQKTESSVLSQVNEKISSDIAANKSQVSIILKPENLGKVNINLVSENGVLTAQITTESTQVKDILNKGLETLRQNMAEQGINVGKMVVNVQEPHTSNQNMNSEQHKNFEQQNTNTNSSNMNSQSGKQNLPEGGASTYSENQSYEFNEENESETSELNTPVGQSSAIHSGKVDYKV